MSKFNVGKASVLALTAVFAFVLFLFSGQSVMAYTQAEFKAFDGVNIGTNSYTVSSGITATYDSGIGTLDNPVLLKLTGYAPIVTPWFGIDRGWTTYNYVTIGIKLPAGFIGIPVTGGNAVSSTGVMRYDGRGDPITGYLMGDGSTPLATTGAASGYLDFSFAANSPNTKQDGLVKLKVIWNASSTPEYFTIDITGLQFTDVCANIDGAQTGVPDGMHLDAGGLNCVNFSQAGPPPAPPYTPATGGQVLGASTTSTGRVLGASTLAGTGSFAENLYLAIMAIGGLITAAGAINFKKNLSK